MLASRRAITGAARLAGRIMLMMILLASLPVPASAGSKYQTLSGSAHLDHVVATVSNRYGVNPMLVHAVIRVESNYDTFAVSHKGAQGLMQLMPVTQRELGVSNPFDPWQNVDGGVRYLLIQLLDFGRLDRALAAYNAGPTREKTGSRPRETRRYIRKVEAEYRRLNASR